MSPPDNNEPLLSSGVTFTKTLSVHANVTTEPTIHVSQEAFSLCEADFLRLKSGAGKAGRWAAGIFIASLGMVLLPLAKLLQTRIFGATVSIETWEWFAPCIGGVIAFILYMIGRILPNERRQVMKDIENHFSIAPRTKHIREQRK